MTTSMSMPLLRTVIAGRCRSIPSVVTQSKRNIDCCIKMRTICTNITLSPQYSNITRNIILCNYSTTSVAASTAATASVTCNVQPLPSITPRHQSTSTQPMQSELPVSNDHMNDNDHDINNT